MFLRAFSTKFFRQSWRFNFRPSQQSSFYVSGVFEDSRGRGPLVNVFLWAFSTKVGVLIPPSQNRRSMFLDFLYIVEGGPLVNVFVRAYFDVFRQSLRFNFRPAKQSSFYVFGVFVGRGTGTPEKRIPEGLFLTFFDKVRVLILDHQNRVRCTFLKFW